MRLLNCTLINSSSVQIDHSSSIYLTDTSSNSVDFNLPVIPTDGVHYIIRNIDTVPTSNITTLIAADGNTIESTTSITVPTGSFIRIVAFGTNWYRIA